MEHIIPAGDIMPHYKSIDCHCSPTVVKGRNGESDTCIHNSFREKQMMRELMEEAAKPRASKSK